MRITFTSTERGVPIIIDAFGKGVEFTERKDGLYDCVVRVPAFDMKLFAMQHCGFIRVTGPQELADEIRADLEKALDSYR